MNVLLFIQSETGNIVAQTTKAPVSETVNQVDIWDLAVKGGWFMIPVALLLLIAVVILIERIFVIKKACKENPTFMNRIKDYIYEGKLDSAINLCQMTNTSISRMIEKGISRLGHPANEILAAIESVVNIEIAKLKKGFAWVATAAAAAPMLGFLGTVIGMVDTFSNMSNAGSKVNKPLLFSGIYESLLATVAGLIVGVIALFAYNYLKAQVTGARNKMENRAMEFMDLLNEPTC